MYIYVCVCIYICTSYTYTYVYTYVYKYTCIHIYMYAAAAAKSLQLCPTLCDPTDGSPPGSLVPGILQARTLEWVAISFSNVYIYVNIDPIHIHRPWCWERLKAGGEEDDRGWDGWMASPTQWTWVWLAAGVGDGQGSLACCSPWGRKESDTT